eukprot:3526-Heterococcus_DN1.PRE.1
MGAGGAIGLAGLLLLSEINLAKLSLLKPVKPAGKACELEFVKYISSQWEQEWASHANEWTATDQTFCEVIGEKGHQDHIAAWVKGALLSQQGCGPFEPYLAEHSDTFSSFEYRDTCTGESARMWIEPLTLLMRHPEAFCVGKDALLDRGYLTFGLASDECKAVVGSTKLLSLAKRMRPALAGHSRLLIFDLGASYYSSGDGGASQLLASSLRCTHICFCTHACCAREQKWFVDTAKTHGAPVSEYYAWEATPQPPDKVWADIPLEMHATYHWFNMPATADPESEANPWNILRKVAAPQDYVVVKLDIDNTPVEEQFIAQLRASSDLSSLIDEFYFEHHVNVSVQPVESARCLYVLLRKSSLELQGAVIIRSSSVCSVHYTHELSCTGNTAAAVAAMCSSTYYMDCTFTTAHATAVHTMQVSIMWHSWQTENETAKLSDTYAIGLDLRKRGVRYHGWP